MGVVAPVVALIEHRGTTRRRRQADRRRSYDTLTLRERHEEYPGCE
jgi:hypothetical protein